MTKQNPQSKIKKEPNVLKKKTNLNQIIRFIKRATARVAIYFYFFWFLWGVSKKVLNVEIYKGNNRVKKKTNQDRLCDTTRRGILIGTTAAVNLRSYRQCY